MRRLLRPWLGLVCGLLIGLLGARLALEPRLVGRAPAPKAPAASTSEVRLTFDQPMDPASVTERLRLNPHVDGEWTWSDRTFTYRPLEPWPVGSTVNIRLEAGVRSWRGLATWRATRWEFTVREPRLAYLWPAGQPADIYSRTVSAEDVLRLTSSGAVTDFSVGAGGTQLVYLTALENGAGQVHLIDLDTGRERLVFECPQAERCSSPSLSPEGSRLAIVRAPAALPSDATTASRRSQVWLIDTDTGSEEVMSAEGSTALAPFWSPQGWLAYVDATQPAIVLVDVSSSDGVAPLGAVYSEMGERGAWSPNGRYLVYPDQRFAADADSENEQVPAAEAHLFRWEVGTGSVIDLSLAAGERVDDAAPAFSPSGDWLIFSRRVLTAGKWTPGRQLWRMRPDGSQAEALSDEPFINHGAPTWSPAGDRLAYLRYDVQAPLKAAEVWWYDLELRQGSPAAPGGYLPTWIP